MRKAARAIVIHENKLLVIKRNKFGHEYYTLPGGGIDPGEEPEHTVVRELREETTLNVSNPRLVIIEEAGDPFGTQLIYLCDFDGNGVPALDHSSVEANISSLGQNTYEPMWLAFNELPNVPFLTKELKQLLIDNLEHGFEDLPITIHSNAEIGYTTQVEKEE